MTPAAANESVAQHQTKCQEIAELPKCPLLQPDLDYLAPEMLRNSSCSHKSDVFSFALILAQAYDLGRHKPPLGCNGSRRQYEAELGKVSGVVGVVAGGRIIVSFGSRVLLIASRDRLPAAPLALSGRLCARAPFKWPNLSLACDPVGGPIAPRPAPAGTGQSKQRRAPARPPT